MSLLTALSSLNINPAKHLNPNNTPQNNTQIIIRKGTTYDRRVIMAGRENNASSPINIQIDTDQQIALEKYICEQETPREKHTK